MLKISQQSIFNITVDVIVNPANTSLLRGSGLCGLIHKNASRKLDEYCKTLSKQCVGESVITPAFKLTACQFIIHSCSPQWFGGLKNEEKNLYKTYEGIIKLAYKQNLKSIAIPVTCNINWYLSFSC